MPTNRTRSRPKKSDAWKATFLDSLGKGATVTAAARGAGVARSTAYDARISDPSFAAQWDENQIELLEVLEKAIYAQALTGDTALLIFIAKSKLKWSDKPHLDDDLRQQVEAMRQAIAELEPDVQQQLLDSYERQLGTQRVLTP